MKTPEKVDIIEVGPRDGIQNESNFISTDKKIELINALNKTGIKRMEATSFVHPKYVPQMRDAKDVLEGIEMDDSIQYMALIPNEKGYDRAIASGIKALSLVVGASDSFNLKNVKMTREKSIESFETVIKKAKDQDIFIRYNIATSFWCPFEGKVDSSIVLDIVEKAEQLGVDEIVICDTIGRANPLQVFHLLEKTISLKPKAVLTAHFHDTYGMALANVTAALEAGVTRFDASIGGLGGCPFAPGAAGNAATEDIVFMLHEMGIETGIDLNQLLACVELVKPLTNRNLTGHLNKVEECRL
ncbi:hydroxymethylglutaryl-CoA lyase [Bacillus sp. AFS076308]|uniref:hydroxymethylglutaryl-CoA lyase n=1 Tax=unclassified Bacillus (in: firmicutes) TaxID=185979 RepID=UPI000BF3B7C2|nr:MULTISPECIES: hydroxymethylglutaryl-CoA lyase [unclassified Bacillus (in: firmicutes)]PFO05040.1 hydroxymethylglutaryl-CoA lyase [Bacillus sp. AFS076308]PGV50549.1 hydroxymethylglutaryl-CoA lyase [Bacillus sp. AFS037270]